MVIALFIHVLVQPGQKIVQTRRSLDFDPSDPLLVAERGQSGAASTLRKEVTPAFVIIGREAGLCLLGLEGRF